MNKNIVTRKFLTQKFANEINVNYGMFMLVNLLHRKNSQFAVKTLPTVTSKR